MTNSLIKRSVIFQLCFGILLHGFLYFSAFEPSNRLYIENITGFLTHLTLGSIWVVAFYELFSGQFLVYLALFAASIFCLWRSRSTDKKFLFIGLFHAFFTIWIVFPILASHFGTYRGP